MSLRARTALLLTLLSLLLAVPGQAQPGYRIVGLEVEGNRVATESLVLGVTSFYLGSPLTQSAIQESMHRLYGLGLFSDVRIEAEEVTGGLKVIVVVKELPKLAGLEMTGNKKIKTKDIKEELGLGVGGYISPNLIESERQKIRSLYSEKGYFQADIRGELEYNEDSTEATLTYHIDERSKVKVENVILTGNVQLPAEKLIGKMRNRKRGFLKSSDFAEDKYNEDLEKVITECHKKGFIDAYMISDSTSIDEATNRMTVYLEIYEGPRYYFGDVSYQGNEVLSDKILSQRLKHNPGEVFNSEKYDESLFEIYTTYQDVGHLHVRVLDERTTRNDSIIDVNYEITEGLPSHIRMVNIVGNTKTKERVIRRELRVFPGQIFNRSLLIRSIREVMALNYFANVEPVPVNLPSGDVDIEFKVEEKQTGQISAGAGYNSTDKMVGSVGMGIPNLAGNGQNLSFNVDFGKRRNSFNVSFTEPYLFGRPTLLGTDLFAMKRRWFTDYTENRQGAAIRLGRRLTWPDNYFRIFASYRLERNKFDDFSEYFKSSNRYSNIFKDQVDMPGTEKDTLVSSALVEGDFHPGSLLRYREQWNTASRLSLTITRDSRNLPEFATEGSMVSYTISQTGGPLGGFWNYTKHSISAAKFIPLFWKFALAARIQFGAISSPNPSDSTILVSDRFIPGGTAYDGVVRGYEDGSLTPDTLVTQSDTTFYTLLAPDTRDTVGYDTIVNPAFRARVRGNYMLVTNIELQFPVVEQSIYALLFFDAGNSWRSFEHIKPFRYLYRGWGFGFRVLVPGIGTIGGDIARPLDVPPNGDGMGWKFHFQIGTTFR